MDDFPAFVAEAIGTFALVFIGAGAVLANQVSGGQVGLLGIALAHGLVLMAMVYATGHVSGGHINPAVTIGLLAAKQIKPKKALFYVVSQLAGAVLAGFALSLAFPSVPASMHLGAPALGHSVSLFAGIAVEAILTFFLVFTVFGTAVDKRAPAGVYGAAIGLVLVFDILAGGVLTGAAMNPARAFGPALASGFMQDQVVYWIGPAIGGVLAALVYSGFLLEKKN